MRALDPGMLSSAARAIAEAIRSDEGVSDKVVKLWIASGRGPANSDEETATIARFTAVVAELLEAVLTQTIELDDEHLSEIRRFFLEPKETYSLQELAALWQISVDDVRDVYHDEIARVTTSNGGGSGEPGKALRIKWAKAMGTTVVFSLLRPFDVEQALGPDFMNVRSERWRTVPVLIRVPRFVADAFELDASIPRGLALAHRVERMLLDLFATEHLTGEVANEVRQQ